MKGDPGRYSQITKYKDNYDKSFPQKEVAVQAGRAYLCGLRPIRSRFTEASVAAIYRLLNAKFHVTIKKSREETQVKKLGARRQARRC